MPKTETVGEYLYGLLEEETGPLSEEELAQEQDSDFGYWAKLRETLRTYGTSQRPALTKEEAKEAFDEAIEAMANMGDDAAQARMECAIGDMEDEGFMEQFRGEEALEMNRVMLTRVEELDEGTWGRSRRLSELYLDRAEIEETGRVGG